MSIALLERPPCMSAKEWGVWLEAALEVKRRNGGGRGGSPVGIRPCQDCTQDFAERMRSEDRCDGVPGRWSEMTPEQQRAYRAADSQRYRRRVKEASE